MCRISLTKNFGMLSCIEKLRAGEFLSKHREISILIDDLLGRISNPFFTVVLFGSYAKGTYDKQSDLDLLFIMPDGSFENELSSSIASVNRISPLGIHEIIITYGEFISMLKEKNLNVAKEVLESHLIFYGSEAFYKMLEAAL